jgi:hypothetical protein
MSDTPKVDSYVYKFPGCQREPRLIDFARQLERELAEAQAEIERLREYTTCTLESTDAEMDDKDIQIIKKDKLIEQMRVALRWYAEQVSNCNRNGDIGELARDRLAKDIGKRAEVALADGGE